MKIAYTIGQRPSIGSWRLGHSVRKASHDWFLESVHELVKRLADCLLAAGRSMLNRYIALSSAVCSVIIC